MEEDTKNTLIVLILGIAFTFAFFAVPFQYFTCDKSKNVCAEKKTVPILNITTYETKIPFSIIKSASTTHEVKETIDSKNRRRISCYSTLSLDTDSGPINIFGTTAGSSRTTYDKERDKINNFLNSSQNKLSIAFLDLMVHFILGILAVTCATILFKGLKKG